VGVFRFLSYFFVLVVWKSKEEGSGEKRKTDLEEIPEIVNLVKSIKGESEGLFGCEENLFHFYFIGLVRIYVLCLKLFCYSSLKGIF
jgi:hypothetical protein